MKPSKLRAWSSPIKNADGPESASAGVLQRAANRRLLTGVIVISAIAIGVGMMAGSRVLGLLVVPSALLLDLIAVAVTRRFAPPPAQCTITLATDGADLITSGSTFPLTVALTPSVTLRGALIAPLLPPAIRSIGAEAIRGTFRGGRTHELTFTCRAVDVGLAVIPGITARRASPLRGLSWSQLIPARTTILVSPGYMSTTNPLVARFMDPRHRAETRRRHVVRGHGTDFHLIREYRPLDPMRTVDWKATARSRELMVREFEEPLEYAVRVVLDTSADMMKRSGEASLFRNAAEFISQLAFVAASQGFGFNLTMYDERGVRSIRLPRGEAGIVHLAGHLSAMPRAVRLQTIAAAGTEARRLLATRAWQQVRRRWNAAALAGSFDELLERYFASAPVRRPRTEFIADFMPDASLAASVPCAACRAETRPDEPACSRCGAALGPGGLGSPRAAAASEALLQAMAATRGRELLLFISTLTGGELRGGIADRLARAAMGHRTVRLVVPNLGRLEDARPRHRSAMGHQSRAEAMRDVVRLADVASFESFRHRILNAGVKLNSIEHRDELDTVVADLLLEEVLAA